MLNRIAFALCITIVASHTVAAQTKPTPTAAKPSTNGDTKAETPAAKPLAEPPAQPVNIKIELSITDQSGSGQAAKKVVTMIASDRQTTLVRSNASVLVKESAGNMSYKTVQINVDAHPAIVVKEPNKVSVTFGLEYLPARPSPDQEPAPGMTSWNERLSVILESGKPMIVSQAADPTSDRKITVEITATILK